jgi:hypothetical protein
MSEPTRQREVVSTEVRGTDGRTLQVQAYHGMLPEDLLVLLSQQSISLRLRGQTSREAMSRMWHGPNEQIQQVLTQGALSRGTGEEVE